jgi:hypothetical protein
MSRDVSAARLLRIRQPPAGATNSLQGGAGGRLCCTAVLVLATTKLQVRVRGKR